MKNGRILALVNSLQALSNIGTDDEPTGLKLTNQILFMQPHAEDVIKERDEILKRKPPQPEVEVSLFMNKEGGKIDFSDAPTFTFTELFTKFKGVPNSSLIAALVPLVVLPE